MQRRHQVAILLVGHQGCVGGTWRERECELLGLGAQPKPLVGGSGGAKPPEPESF